MYKAAWWRLVCIYSSIFYYPVSLVVSCYFFSWKIFLLFYSLTFYPSFVHTGSYDEYITGCKNFEEEYTKKCKIAGEQSCNSKLLMGLIFFNIFLRNQAKLSGMKLDDLLSFVCCMSVLLGNAYFWFLFLRRKLYWWQEWLVYSNFFPDSFFVSSFPIMIIWLLEACWIERF